LFDVIAHRPDDAVAVLRNVRAGLERWSSARHVSQVAISDVRRRVLTDPELERIKETFPVAALAFELELLSIRASQSCIHGDLHGGNILVNAKQDVVLIDFGDVGPGFTCLDPVTLELSLIFHPEAVRLGFSEKLSAIVEHWPDVDRYIEDNEFGTIIETCREWAHDVGGGDKDVLACGYSFALRQLKYGTVDPAITLKLLESVRAKLS
jgi:aminoglycoside phosphotransferase (APT) family kinase protein